MKIKQYQTGGIVYTPYIPNRAEHSQETSDSSKSNQPEKISGTFTKEIIDILKENGIPNDVDAFLQEADSFLGRSSGLSAFSIFGGDGGDHNLSDIIKVHSLANRVKTNKQLYDNAIVQLTKEGAGAEVAIDDRGHMYVYSGDGGIEIVSPTEYYKNINNEGSYTALTNSQLLSLRESQPGLAYNRDILHNMTSSIGMQSITTHIKDTIKNFGTSQLDGYVSKSRDRVGDGLQELMMGGPDGNYQYSLKSQVDKGDEQDVDFALNYIYGTLPEQMKSLLRAKAAAEGMDPNSKAARQQLLYMALMEHTSESIGVSFDKSATSGAGIGGSGGGTVDKSYIENVATVGPTLLEDYTITPAGSGVSLVAKGQNFARPITRTEEEVPQNNLAVLFGVTDSGKSAYAFSAGDIKSTSFAGAIVSAHDLHKLVWDGSSEIIKVWLPFTTTDEGRTIPDFQLQHDIAEVNRYIKEHQPGMTDMQLRELMNGPLQGKAIQDPDNPGQLIIAPENAMGFLTLSVYAGDDTIGFDTNSPYVEKVDTQTGKQITDIYDNFVQYNAAIPAKNAKVNTGKYSTSTRGDFYKGNVFVPITNKGVGVLLGNAEKFPKDVYTNIQQKVQNSATKQSIIATWQ